MVRIKQTYRALENDLVLTEKMLAASGIEYDKNALKNAEKSMLFCQFHDILPGSMIKKGEDDAIREMGYAREILARMKMKSFVKLCEGQEKGKSGEIPVMVFNPNPYRISEDIEVEFLLANQNWTENQVTVARVRDNKGNYIPAQNEKESSSLMLDWVKRVAFHAELEPMSINRFDLELVPYESSRRPIFPCESDGECFIIRNDRMCVRINKTTGLIDKYEVDGQDYLNCGAKISVYKDNEDPWGMTVDGFYDKIGSFEAVSDSEANKFNGCPDDNYSNVRVVENGDLRTRIQAIFKSENSYAIITYTVPKQGVFVDINVKILSNDVNRMYKLDFDTALSNTKLICQSAFGREEMEKRPEVVMQKWCAMVDDNKAFCILNRGTYGLSANGSSVGVSQLRTPVYSAHPLANRPLCEHDFIHDHIDMGERSFDFRITAEYSEIDKAAEIYNQSTYVLSFFPSGNGKKQDTSVEILDNSIIMTSFRRQDDGSYFIRLFNSSDKEVEATLKMFGNEFSISQIPYEICGYIFKNSELIPTKITGEY